MSEYHDNGYGGDFKRNPDGGGETGEGGGPAGGGGGGLSEPAGAYLRSLLSEKIKLSQSGALPFAGRLLDQEVDRVQSQGRAHPPERFVDVYRQKPVKVVAKVLVPIKEHPRFNFVGKLLGPKGNTMKQLQEETLCKMAVLGRGSMKDRQKEEELRTSLDPKYAHLSDDLHVEISALGPPAEAHARIAYALAEVRKYMIPDQPDGHPGMPHMMERGPPMRPPPMSRPPMPPKSKVMSILDRARAANEDPYQYEDPYARPEPPARSARGGGDYYGYERPAERYVTYEEEFYKPPVREYKTAARDGGGGARRGAGAGQRFGARDAPYGRAPKQH